MPITPANAKMLQASPLNLSQKEPFLTMWDKMLQVPVELRSMNLQFALHLAGLQPEVLGQELRLRLTVHPSNLLRKPAYATALQIAYYGRFEFQFDDNYASDSPSAKPAVDGWRFDIAGSNFPDVYAPVGTVVKPEEWKETGVFDPSSTGDLLLMFACLRLQHLAFAYGFDTISSLPNFTRAALFAMLPADVQAAESVTASERREMERKQRKLDRIEEKRKREALIESIRRETEDAIAASQRDEIQTMFNFFQREADELTSSLHPNSATQQTLAKRDVRQQVATEIPPAGSTAHDTDAKSAAGGEAEANPEQIYSQAQADVDDILLRLRTGRL